MILLVKSLVRCLRIAGVAAFCATAVVQSFSQSPSDKAVRVSAQVQTNPPRITLSWPGDSRSVTYFVARKLRDEDAWGALEELGTEVTSYVDTNVVVGGAFEYWITKWTSDTFILAGEGYICAGIEVPLVESRGKVILMVDETHASSLTTELSRMVDDLVGDGWTVLRHDVARMAVEPSNMSTGVWAARSNELYGVKAWIKTDYEADPGNVKAVLLFGHLPVPYSGDLFPDAHSDHRGAWPADGFFGDMDGVWTDSTVERSSSSDPRNRNVVGDGKFDQTLWPAWSTGRQLEFQVGRVDFANMPAFALDETELLRRYLNKNHGFRHGLISVGRRGLIDDNLGWFLSEAPAANGWRNFAPFFWDTNTIPGDWLTVSSEEICLWGFGCGAGTYTSCSGVASTSQLASGDPRVVFTMLFGS
jgi:hypothetical protein